MQTTQELPTSEHFELHELAEGVYAAIAIEGGAAFSNAGIVDLGFFASQPFMMFPPVKAVGKWSASNVARDRNSARKTSG